MPRIHPFYEQIQMMSESKRVCYGRRRFLFCFCLPLMVFLPFFFSVLELHEKQSVEDIHMDKPKKFDHLILGPAAGEGLLDRLQCQGLHALNKTQLSASFDDPMNEERVVFVTVFTTYNSSSDSVRPSDLVTVGNVSYNKVERSLAILNVFIDFIQVTMPSSTVAILTDPSSNLPVRRTGVSVHPIQGEYSRDRLMLQRIRSYIAFLETKIKDHNSEQHKKINHYVFTDSDIAVVGDLRGFFFEYPNFHVALTFRNNKEQPINSGFIAVRGTIEGLTRGKAFLEDVLKVYSSKFMKASRMLGDQLALAYVVRSHPSFDVKLFTKKKAFLHEIRGSLLLFLPCSIYNWTPPEGAGQFHGMPLDVKVIHFKGSRKRLMLEAWNYLHSSSDLVTPDMLCLVLKSGRTKYDF